MMLALFLRFAIFFVFLLVATAFIVAVMKGESIYNVMFDFKNVFLTDSTIDNEPPDEEPIEQELKQE